MFAPRRAALLAVAVPFVLGAPDAWAAQHFVTRPDLTPPKIRIDASAGKPAPGYVFAAPKNNDLRRGPMIFDNRGNLVWYAPEPNDGYSVLDFKRQTYEGKPVLTWWHGTGQRGWGYGRAVIYDTSYRKIATVSAKNGYKMDHHEFVLTDRGTALFDCYKPVRQDTRSVPRGSRRDRVVRNVIQEVDVKTGKLLFQWNANNHIRPEETYREEPIRTYIPLDYIHLNSIDVDDDGNLILSARETSALYKIDRETGRIIWRLGGRRSDFSVSPDASFRYQHDAQRQDDGTITLFDNNAVTGTPAGQSSALRLRVDERAMTVSAVRRYTHPTEILSTSQGNTQVLPGGHVFVGWGGEKNVITEFTRRGDVAFEAKMFPKSTDTYRAYRFKWRGRPAEPPVANARRAGDLTVVHVSWNGATDVAYWRVYGGTGSTLLGAGWSGTPSTATWLRGSNQLPSADLTERTSRRPLGFETRIRFPAGDRTIRVDALAQDGTVLGSSADVRVR